MFDEKVYWLWLQHAFGTGSEKPASIAKRFNTLDDFYNGGRRLWSSFDFISEKELATMTLFTPAQAEAQIEYCERIGQEVFTFADDEYPESLRHIHAPPAVLFVKGSIADFNNGLTISVVGSRKADQNAIKNTEYICYELSKAGAIVVSGGAIGIDAAAHRGALRGFGTTAAFLACGIDYPYLMQNQMLREKIVDKGGCLITEYPVNTGVTKGSFQIRNRLMSGIANGLLVVRAEAKGGTMLTVAHATRQNKDIFAIPGDINDPYSEGTNRLIKDGATPVLRPDDILEQYSHLYKKKRSISQEILSNSRKNIRGLSQKTEMVYNTLSSEPIHASVICAQTGLKISQVLAAITELELLDCIKTYSGQRCSLK